MNEHEEEVIPFEVSDEVILTDLDAVQETRQVLPVSQGVRVKIEKPKIKKSLSDNSKEAPKEGPNNPVAFKRLNPQFRIMDGISVPVYDENGNLTGETELKYKNKVFFAGNMDFIFWHNPEVKTKDWWKNLQYIFSFRQLCKAVGYEPQPDPVTGKKITKVNDEFLMFITDKEILLDISQVPEQEQKTNQKTGEITWVDKGTFKNAFSNFRAWS